MPHLYYRNVNDAFRDIVDGIDRGTIETVTESSRNGDVMSIPDPVIISYKRPTERVLFNVARDCNPFFHVFESLWMLAGRNDIAPLGYYNQQMLEYSDDGYVQNGAYGYRWRKAERRLTTKEERGELDLGERYVHYKESGQNFAQVDQLKVAIEHLRRKPDSRRVVIQMWNVENDLLKIDTSKDVCCNLSVLLRLRKCEEQHCMGGNVPPWMALDMTVTNRSNDLIWGTLGANVVHFSFLQEYLAAQLDARVGTYHQFSVNQHVYKAKWEPEKWLKGQVNLTSHDPIPLNYDVQAMNMIPLVLDPERFDNELPLIVDTNCPGERMRSDLNQYTRWEEPFFNEVAQPMFHAWHMHKARDYDAALQWTRRILSEDWRVACVAWLLRRKKAWEEKSALDRVEESSKE